MKKVDIAHNSTFTHLFLYTLYSLSSDMNDVISWSSNSIRLKPRIHLSIFSVYAPNVSKLFLSLSRSCAHFKAPANCKIERLAIRRPDYAHSPLIRRKWSSEYAVYDKQCVCIIHIYMYMYIYFLAKMQ